MLVQTVNDFDRLTVQVVDETIKYCLGEANANLICNYLEEQDYPLTEIPLKPERFSEELRNLLGFGSRHVLGAPSILEESILEILCEKLGIGYSVEKPPDFPKQIRKLRERYKSGHGSVLAAK
jgi:hypothetical protein